MAVDVASRCPGIIKHFLAVLAVIQQLGHHGTYLGVSLHIVIERVEPALRRAHIAVEQHGIGIHGLADSDVIPLGKAVVLVKLEHLDLREFLFQHLQTVIGAAVVCDNDVGNGSIGARNHCGQVAA